MCFENATIYRKAESRGGAVAGNRFLSDHNIMQTEDFLDQSSDAIFSNSNTATIECLELKATNARAPLDTRVVDTGNLTLFDTSSSINDHLDAFNFDDLDSVSVSDSFSRFA